LAFLRNVRRLPMSGNVDLLITLLCSVCATGGQQHGPWNV